MHIRDLFMVALIFTAGTSNSQVEDIFLGAGNDSSITVTTSHDHQLYSGLFTASGDKTVNGDGMNAKKMEVARFLVSRQMKVDHLEL